MILFLAANSAVLPALELAEECRSIEAKIRGAKFRDQVRFRSRWAARPDDLIQALNEDEPAVLHFSGHGGGEPGIYFQGDDGAPHAVTAEALAGVVRAAGEAVSLVVLNACFSEVQAKLLAQTVPCGIGLSEAIGDGAAIVYAESFYRALAFGKSVANAHAQGLSALAFDTTDRELRREIEDELDDDRDPGRAASARIPQLLVRPGTDAAKLCIVTAPAPVIAAPRGGLARAAIPVALLVLAVAGAFAIGFASRGGGEGDDEHSAPIDARPEVAIDAAIVAPIDAAIEAPIDARPDTAIDAAIDAAAHLAHPRDSLREATAIVAGAKPPSCASLHVSLSTLTGVDGNVLTVTCRCTGGAQRKQLAITRDPSRALILDDDLRDRLRAAASQLACP